MRSPPRLLPTFALVVLSSTARAETASGTASPGRGQKPPFGTGLGVAETEQLLSSGELQLGLNNRLSHSETFDFEESIDLSLGLSAWLEPTRILAAGLGYDRVGLGSSHTDEFPGIARALYDLNAFWVGLRAFPFRIDRTRLFLQLKVGASLQEVEASGLRQDSIGAGNVYQCFTSEGPGLGLGAGAGIRIAASESIRFVTQADLGAHQLSSALIRNCAPGVGSVTQLSVRFGFAYVFDLLHVEASSDLPDP